MKAWTNARVVLLDSVIEKGFLTAENGRILSVGAMEDFSDCTAELVDCQGHYLSPGFVDLHVHGGGGHDFMDGTVEAMLEAARTHLRHGTTTLLPTTLASSDEELFEAIDNFKAAQKVREQMPHLPGMHLEGPYFNHEQKGAQDARYIINPTPAHYNRILEKADGAILRWSVAPELPGALEMGRALAGEGILLSIGHSSATYTQVQEAFDNGFTHLTHFYSAMSTITRSGGFRLLGVVESAYLIDGLTVEIIADGMHLPPELLRMILKCKNNKDICLVTDGMRGADMPQGESILGGLRNGQTVVLEDGIAKMPDRSCFAGSVATTDRLVRVMTGQAGLSVPQAVAMMTLQPARFIGYDRCKGSLEAGKDADLVLFDEDIQVKEVFVLGEKVTGYNHSA